MKILVSDPVSEKGVAILREQFEVDVKTKLSVQELINIIPEYDGLVVRSETKVTAKVLDAAKKLKVIGRAGVGVDNIDVEHATKCGVIVLNAPEGNTMAATEHTVAMMLGLARNIPQAYKSMQEGKWERPKFTGVEVRGRTLGIFGLGRIGTGVAKRALALEMNVLAYDPFMNMETVNALGIRACEVDEILELADFVTLHLPKTPQTVNMFNKESFAKMKKGMRIVNCARGGVINEADLIEAIEQGIVAGAALDVFETEPLQADSPLLACPQIITTPHLGASTVEAQVGVAVDVAHGIVSALKGEPVSTAVNMTAVPSHILQQIRPYFDLATSLGSILVQISEGRLEKIVVEYKGDIAKTDTKMLTTSVIKGVFNHVLQDESTINFVNAPSIAKTRGVEVLETKQEIPGSFANLITVRLFTDKEKYMAAGTLFGKEARIVSINNHRVDTMPAGNILLCPHDDLPGMVGQVGTILGQAGVNISSMQVGKTEVGGTNIMVLGIGAPAPEAVLEQLRKTGGIIDAKLVTL